MVTKTVDVGRIIGLNSYEMAVQSGNFVGTYEEYVKKEQAVYDEMKDFANKAKVDMESQIASVTDSISSDNTLVDLSELISARDTYESLGFRLDALDTAIDALYQRTQEMTDSEIGLNTLDLGQHIELRNNGVYLQWRFLGYRKWENLISLEDLTPNFTVGEVTTINPTFDEVVNGETPEASVTITGTTRNPVLNFAIPKGLDGVDGGSIVNMRLDEDGNCIIQVRNNDEDEESKEVAYTLYSRTLKTTDWVLGSSGKYYVRIFVNTINEDSNIILSEDNNITDVALNALRNAIPTVSNLNSGRFDVVCNGTVPVVDIPIYVMVGYKDGSTTYVTPVISIGEVETLEYDEPAYATITGTPTNPILNLGLPKGKPTKITRGYIDDNGELVFETE